MRIKIGRFPVRRSALMLLRPWLWSMHPLTIADLQPDPISQFREWFKRAQRSFWIEFPEAMCLSTVDQNGTPDGRMVLLKEVDEDAFVFYSNSQSVKGDALQACPRAALTFYWEALQRQVRVQGAVEQVSAEEADAYFATRPRASQIGAWASQQSRPLADRRELIGRVKEFRTRFAGQRVPRPPHWNGYRVVAERIEFWKLRASRLHDRFQYTRRKDGGWTLIQLYP